MCKTHKIFIFYIMELAIYLLEELVKAALVRLYGSICPHHEDAISMCVGRLGYLQSRCNTEDAQAGARNRPEDKA